MNKVIKTLNYLTKCECGETVKQGLFGELQEDSTTLNGVECMIGFCKCGNIFVSQLPMKMTEEDREELKKVTMTGTTSINVIVVPTIEEKAMEKAEKNGWDSIPKLNPKYPFYFSHDFAKAFFGEYEKKEDLPSAVIIAGNFVNHGTIEIGGVTKWQYHLQQMVLEENPIKYLEQFLNE